MVSRWPRVVVLLVVLAASSAQPAPRRGGGEDQSDSTHQNPLQNQRTTNNTIAGMGKMGSIFNQPRRKPAPAANPAPTTPKLITISPIKEVVVPNDPKFSTSTSPDNNSNDKASDGDNNNHKQLIKWLSGSGGFSFLILVLLCLRRRK